MSERNRNRYSLFRTFCFVLSVMIFALFTSLGTLLMVILYDDVLTMADRLGADIMIVPVGYDPHVDNILLSGKPSASYLPEDSLEIIKNLADEKISGKNLGIEKISPQVFMATLRASCCAYPVQIMGIDYESDFIVRAWLDKKLKRPLKDGEIILGWHNNGDIGDEIIFFNKPLKIVGKLERTGMGLDSSVFMNRNTIIELAKAADKIKEQKLAANNKLNSVIMLKLHEGQDIQATSRALNKELNSKGMFALVSKKFVSNISSNLVRVSRITKYFLIFLWLSAFIIIVLSLLRENN